MFFYKIRPLCSIAHLTAYEEGYAEEGADVGSNAKIGRKEWLQARKRAIIKKSSEEGFQDRAIRALGGLVSLGVMFVMLYGAIGLLSGDGVEQLPCETTRALGCQCFLPDARLPSCLPVRRGQGRRPAYLLSFFSAAICRCFSLAAR